MKIERSDDPSSWKMTAEFSLRTTYDGGAVSHNSSIFYLNNKCHLRISLDHILNFLMLTQLWSGSSRNCSWSLDEKNPNLAVQDHNTLLRRVSIIAYYFRFTIVLKITNGRYLDFFFSVTRLCLVNSYVSSTGKGCEDSERRGVARDAMRGAEGLHPLMNCSCLTASQFRSSLAWNWFSVK